MVNKITVEAAFELKSTLFIDARTPKEYAEDHLLGAVNVPLLSNEERHEIGLIYKQQSREKAIEKGLELFPTKIPSIYNAVKDHKNKTIVVYCARGGMRSNIIASLLESVGFKVLQLEGGYKSFRNYLLQQLKDFKIKPKIICLYGLTCSGKTELLKKLPNALDLEGLAQHRGSLYGAIGLTPHSQKKFENLLLDRLKQLNEEKYIFTEGESRKIGNVEIPAVLFTAMKKGINVLVTRSIDRRAEEAVKEYFSSPENIKKIIEITPQLKENISRENKEEIVKLINEKKYQAAVKILLEKYYDPLYAHTLKQQKYTFTINNDDVEKAVEEIKSRLPELKLKK
ncbi:MAG: tRNA 2-selenouridine(34) synthase MnmH [Nanoarchaeota archaeon]